MEQEVSQWDAFDEADRQALMEEIAAAGGEGFTPDTAEKAAWLTSRVAYHQAEAERIKTAMQAELKRHQQAADYLLQRYSSALEAFARQAIDAEGGKRQKHVLPNGVSLAFRRIPDSLIVHDESAVLAWAADALPEAIKQTLAKAPVTAHWKDTGELPPGCVPVRDRVGFYIKS